VLHHVSHQGAQGDGCGVQGAAHRAPVARPRGRPVRLCDWYRVGDVWGEEVDVVGAVKLLVGCDLVRVSDQFNFCSDH